MSATASSFEKRTRKSPSILPRTTIQEDFTNVLNDIRSGLIPLEEFWLSCYSSDRPSVHGKVRASQGSTTGIVDLEGRDGVYLNCKDEFTYVAFCPDLDIPPTQIIVPRHILRDLRGDGKDDGTVNMQPSALAVAPDRNSIAVGYADGRVRCVPLSQAIQAKLVPSTEFSTQSLRGASASISREASAITTLTPHHSGTAVTSLSFFSAASDQTRRILSAGVDGTIHLLQSPSDSSLDPSTPSCSLKGHFRPVTAAFPLDDVHVLSVSRDRSLRIWDVKSSSQLRMESLGSGANALSVSSDSFGGNKVAFIGLDSGKVAFIDIRSPNAYINSFAASDKALTALAFSPVSNILAVGDTQGVISTFDLRAVPSSDTLPQNTIHSFTRGPAEVMSLSFLASTSLSVCTEDWLPFVASLDNSNASVLVATELTGAGGGDCAPVRAFTTCVEGGSMWAAGEDGAVRAYVV